MSEPVSEEMRQSIERGLREWHDTESPTRQKYEAARDEWDRALRPLNEAIEASTRLTGEDMTMRIGLEAPR